MPSSTPTTPLESMSARDDIEATTPTPAPAPPPMPRLQNLLLNQNLIQSKHNLEEAKRSF